MNDGIAIAIGNVMGMAIFVGGIAACAINDQRVRRRRRKLGHVERMRSIELGRPLDDASIERSRALGAIGVATPVASFIAACIIGLITASSSAESSVRVLVPVVCLALATCATAAVGHRVATSLSVGSEPDE